MEENIKKVIEEYQCPGCMDKINCFEMTLEITEEQIDEMD